MGFASIRIGTSDMAYSDFTYPEVLHQLGLEYHNVEDLFAGTPDLPASPELRKTLGIHALLASATHTEMARAVWLVGPVLGELWGHYRGQISLWAGEAINVDRDANLTGNCDFVLGRSPQLPSVTAPVAVIVEAKRDDLVAGMGQCVAAMVGAQRFNAQTGQPPEAVYGAVTTGMSWKFLQLMGKDLHVDLTEYALAQVDRILGILRRIIGKA